MPNGNFSTFQGKKILKSYLNPFISLCEYWFYMNISKIMKILYLKSKLKFSSHILTNYCHIKCQ
jgi:hypothetical protein